MLSPWFWTDSSSSNENFYSRDFSGWWVESITWCHQILSLISKTGGPLFSNGCAGPNWIFEYWNSDLNRCRVIPTSFCQSINILFSPSSSSKRHWYQAIHTCTRFSKGFCNQDLVYMTLQSDYKIGRLSLIFFYWWLYNWGFLRDFSQIKAQNRRKRCKMSDNSLLIYNNYLRAVEVASIRPPINICSRAPFQKNYLHIKASSRWYKICRKSFLHSSLPCLDPMLINKIAC